MRLAVRLIALIACAGCSGDRTHVTESLAPEVPVADSQVAEWPTPGLPVVRLKHDSGDRTFDLRADYGFIIDWPDTGTTVTPSFYAFDRERETRVRYAEWDQFLAHIQSLPIGAEVHAIQKCTAGFSGGMPADSWAELQSALAAREITLMDSDSPKYLTMCYCETRGYDILHDAAPQRP